MDKQTKPEICYECYFFRVRTENMTYLCVNPKSNWCDRKGIRKATTACEYGKLNPKFITWYPHRYEDPNPDLLP